MTSFFDAYIGWRGARLAQLAVDRGIPPGLVGYRRIRKESLADYARRCPRRVELEEIHPATRHSNALPRTFPERMDLPDDRGWWGYSMRDVPDRSSAPTVHATLQDATVLPFVDPEVGSLRPAILTSDESSLELREISFRSIHRRAMRASIEPRRLQTATWILERVYDNHSHWLTAHLPKLRLLRDRGKLEDVLMPSSLPDSITRSLRMLGIDPGAFRTIEFDRPLLVERLDLLSMDRFRPELLRPVREAFERDTTRRNRRIYISRGRAERRRLLNEEEIWPRLAREGFERIFMEDLDFEAQVRIMQEASAVIAPHGAGLTNVMFCPERTAVVEIADLGFPNPNFYALASAMGHRYWLVSASSRGTAHPLERDLWVDPAQVEAVLGELAASS